MELQKTVTRRVEEDANFFLKKYKLLPQSFSGRYICSDLFKELISEYAVSNESRTRYNAPIHNAAAILAAEYYNLVQATPCHDNL
jgi:glycyl-tRNA synthetase alpha subunit